VSRATRDSYEKQGWGNVMITKDRQHDAAERQYYA